MRNPALIVPREEAERTRRALLVAGLLRTDLRVRREGDRVALPIVGHDRPLPSGESGEREFEPLAGGGAKDYRELVDLPAEERRLLPRAFDVVGEIVLLRLPAALEPRASEIGSALLRFVPGARLVGVDHGVKGPARRRALARIAGDGPFRTVHRENGLDLAVDLEAAYFSPRLAREHARVAGQVRDGEAVADLCCGVGPFALTIARDRRAGSIVAVDLNPAAIELLRRSAAARPHATPIETVVDDVGAYVGRSGAFDRVVLNLPHDGIKYLPQLATHVRPGGTVHYYEVTPRRAVADRGEELVRTMGGPDRWVVALSRVVHPYSPRDDLVSFDLARRDREGR